MLEVRNLDFDYPDKQVLQAVDFAVEPGNLLHLRGANGTGKTTLLKLLAGLLIPERGEIHYKGNPVIDDLAAYQQNICYISHKPGISLLLSVQENYRYGLQELPQSISLQEAIKHFSLDGVENTPCSLLSAGQRRRAGLIKLLFSDAALWLLDEPLVSLDQKAVKILLDCMAGHLAGNGMIVMTSHQNLPQHNLRFAEYCL